jgi:hypothetical protein
MVSAENDMRTLKDQWIVILIVVAFTLVLFDILGGRRVFSSTATVVAKSYTPERTSFGSGTAVGSDGQVHVVSTTSTEDEKYVLIVDSGREVFSVNTNPKTWADAKDGSPVSVFELRGKWTGIRWSRRAE